MGMQNVSLDSDPGALEAGQLLPVKGARGPQRRLNDGELRVLIFTACYFVLDGVTLTIRRLESYLRSKGATVMIVTTIPKDADPEQCRDLIPVPAIDIPFTGAGYAFGGGLDEETFALIEAYNPNVCHFTVPDLVGFDGVKWCLENRVGYMATWHSNYADYLKYYFLEWAMKALVVRHIQSFYEMMPTIYVPTPYIRDKMGKEGFGKQCVMKEWGRGVDLKLFSPDRRSQAFRDTRGIAPNDIVILWMGRIVAEKRPDIFLQVVQQLQNEGVNVHALVVGHGTYAGQLEEQLDHVTCCGWLSGSALAEAYASADILLFPSAVETFGNVTLEALASGCVCVVEEMCGGHLVDHGHNGFACAAGDTEQFYNATKRIVMDEHLRKQLSVNARQSAWKFERSKILQMMAENYKDAIELTHEETYELESQRKLAQGEDDVIKTFCCISWRQCMRGIAEPLFQTTASFTELANNTQDLTGQCTNKMRFSCSDLRGSLEDDWHDYKMDKGAQQKKKQGLVASVQSLWLWAKDLTLPAISNDMIRTTTIATTALSYVVVFTFILTCLS